MLARFLEALRHREVAARFDKRGRAGFEQLGAALDAAMQEVQRERLAGERDPRFLKALVDDAPVALLVVEAERGITRQQAGAPPVRPPFRHSPAGLRDLRRDLRRAAGQARGRVRGTRRELLLLRLQGRLQRTIVRTAMLERLGSPVHLVSLEPVQGTLCGGGGRADRSRPRADPRDPRFAHPGHVAVAHAGGEGPGLRAARHAPATLARRTEGLCNFIDSYRALARAPMPRPVRFAAAPFAPKLERLFRAEWPACRLEVAVGDGLALRPTPTCSRRC